MSGVSNDEFVIVTIYFSTFTLYLLLFALQIIPQYQVHNQTDDRHDQRAQKGEPELRPRWVNC